MEELLIVILQVFGEIIFQILGSGMLDVVSWGWEYDESRGRRGCTIVPMFLIIGGLLGWLTVLVVPHSLMPWGWLRMINLIIGPLISGWVSWRIAHWRLARGRHNDPGEHALIAASACLGLVLVRFVLVIRG